MSWKITTATKVDPSSIRQDFTDINLKVHCCRYWKLQEWEYQNMSFPFWRMYYNTLSGASIMYKGKKIELNAQKIILIPPHTAFTTQLWGKKNARAEERLTGSRIESLNDVATLQEVGMIDHLFIHFNLGFQLDRVQSGFYEFEATEERIKLLERIRTMIIQHSTNITLEDSLLIYTLLLNMVSHIEASKWEEQTIDNRVLRVIDHIDQHFGQSLTNEELASTALMAPNSFLRLFKQATGYTIQQFIHNKRVEKAIALMHHGHSSIDEIASICGYSDRHHFTKVFTKITKTSPAKYRKSRML